MRNLENATSEGVTDIQLVNLVAPSFGLIFHQNGTEAVKCQITSVKTLT